MRTLPRLKMFIALTVLVSSLSVTAPLAAANTPEEEAALQQVLSQVLFAESLYEEHKAVTAAWLSYALGRIVWLKQNAPERMENSVYYRSFEEELYGRESLVKVWEELQEKEPDLENVYLDELLVVYKNGYLKEYVWLYLGDETWEAPSEERVTKFLEWEEMNLPGHQVETLAGLTFEVE